VASAALIPLIERVLCVPVQIESLSQSDLITYPNGATARVTDKFVEELVFLECNESDSKLLTSNYTH